MDRQTVTDCGQGTGDYYWHLVDQHYGRKQVLWAYNVANENRGDGIGKGGRGGMRNPRHVRGNKGSVSHRAVRCRCFIACTDGFIV
jgi:hypothetical protein